MGSTHDYEIDVRNENIMIYIDGQFFPQFKVQSFDPYWSWLVQPVDNVALPSTPGATVSTVLENWMSADDTANKQINKTAVNFIIV